MLVVIYWISCSITDSACKKDHKREKIWYGFIHVNCLNVHTVDKFEKSHLSQASKTSCGRFVFLGNLCESMLGFAAESKIKILMPL